MIQVILLNILLDNRKTVEIALSDEVWDILEKKKLGVVVENYLNGKYNKSRALRGIMKAMGVTSKEYKTLIKLYTSMRPKSHRYVRLTVSIPPNIGDILEIFKSEGGKKSQLVAASLDNIISKVGSDIDDLKLFVNKWLITEKKTDPKVPDSAFKIREQKAKLDEKAETRVERRARALKKEQDEFDSMRSKKEIESRKRQQQAINELIEDFKRKHEGRKPTREEYTELMMSAKKRHPIVMTDKKNPTTIEAIENARKRQAYINKQEEKKLEKKKKKKTKDDDNDVF